jgi:purine-nucleoside phosphorylase
MTGYSERVERAAVYVGEKVGTGFHAAIILGSGLGKIAEGLEGKKIIAYSEIPGFPSALIEGHRGELVAGSIGGKRTLVYSGRFHYYQGYSLAEVTLPVRIAKRLGISLLIVTNASGGINVSFKPGDIMLISDHINNMGVNPLIGSEATHFGPLFIDMSEPYDRLLRERAGEIAAKDGRIGKLKEGVYLATMGPSYETKAEISFFNRIGADAVGMSTVPEVIVAVQEALRVLGISVITNMACGIGEGALSHEEVLSTMERAGSRVILLIREVLRTFS